ncbi:MAG: PorP/SprF family type IX secretion system membrane protein [Bacteroidota bacterium]
MLKKAVLKLVIIICCVLLLPKGSNAQQYFTYSQYMNNLTPVNHNYALLDRNSSISSIYRKQWTGIEGAPATFLLTGAIPLEEMGAATGLVVMDDKFAVEHQTEVNAYFAKSIQLSPEGYLAVSLDAGFRSYIANYSQLAPTDPSFSTDFRETRPNLGFSVMYYTKQFYLGVSVPELNVRSLGNSSIENNAYFRNHYYFSGAFLTGKPEDEIRIKPAFLYTYTQGIPSIADLSATLYLKNVLGIGGNYRTNKEAAAIMTLNFSPVTFGYSYRFGTASATVSGISFATHELMLTFHFGRHLTDNKLL